MGGDEYTAKMDQQLPEATILLFRRLAHAKVCSTTCSALGVLHRQCCCAAAVKHANLYIDHHKVQQDMATSHISGTDLCPLHMHSRLLFSHGCVLVSSRHASPYQSTGQLAGVTVVKASRIPFSGFFCLCCAGRQGEEEGCSSSSQGEAGAGS